MSRFSVSRFVVVAIAFIAFTSNSFAQAKPVELKPLWSIRDDDDRIIVEKPGEAFMSGPTSWIGDFGKMQLVHVDAKGQLINAIGRKGAGPGEFEYIGWFGIGANDSIYVWDNNLRRVSIFAPTGKIARTEVLESGEGSSTVFGRMKNGQWLIKTITGQEHDKIGAWQETIQINIASTMHGPLKKVLAIPGNRQIMFPGGNGQNMPFEGLIRVTACDAGFIISGGNTKSIRAYNAEGRLLREVNLKEKMPAMTSEMRSSRLEWDAKSSDPDGSHGYLKVLNTNAPNPAYETAEFSVGRDGRIWLHPTMFAFQFSNVALDGTIKQTVALPRGFGASQLDGEGAIGKRYSREFSAVERFVFPPDVATAKNAPNALHPSLGSCSRGVIF